MIIETKFNLNDKVYYIRKSMASIFIKCKRCKGKGSLELLEGGSVGCPDCYSRGGESKLIPDQWMISSFPSPIGKIGVIYYRKKEKRKPEHKYMIESTGIGSGSVYHEKDLFKRKRDAEKECVIRNSKPISGSKK